jgi:hypothetical protein
MGAPARNIQLVSIFRDLAQAVGARSAEPQADGSLLLRFQAEDGDASRLWKPGEQPDPDLERAMTGLAGAVDPFAVSPASSAPIELDERFVESHLASFLVKDATSWGKLLFRGVVKTPSSALRFLFEGAGAQVVFEVFPVESGGRYWTTAGPLALRVVDDTRPQQLREGLDGRIDHYLAYALNRSVSPGQPVVTSGDSPGAPDPELARAVWRNLAAGFEVPDYLDETPEDSFFFADAERQMGCHEQVATLMNADEGVAFLFHVFDECTTKYAWLGSTRYLRNMHVYSRFSPLPITFPSRRVDMFEVTQMDAITGSDEALVRRVRARARDEKTRIVVVAGTCVGVCTGMDLEGLVGDLQGETDVPVVTLNLTIDSYTSVSRFWKSLFQIARKDQKTRKGTVNLAGFCPADSAFAREFEETIGGRGFTLGGNFVPSYSADEAERFHQAEFTLVSTAEFSRREFSEAQEFLEGMRFVEARPPFGPQATRRLYQTVLEQFGLTDAAEQAERLWEPYRDDWDRYRARAAGHQAGLIVKPQDVRYLLNPDLLYGINLVELLRDMGFSVRIMAVSGNLPGGAKNVVDSLQEELDRQAPDDDQVILEVVDDDRPVAAMIQASPACLFFTEYPPDQRILGAGKMAFHPRDFELGFGGALRTIARLTRLAHNRFHSSLEPAARLPAEP